MKLTFDSRLGYITVSEEDGKIDGVYFGNYEGKDRKAILEEAKKQIEEYLAGERREFYLPLKQKGTGFQKKIWEFLMTIPYGKTATYKQAAEYAGCPKGARAAGGAIGSNPIAIIVPCHRVIGSDGSLTGYEYGTEIKKKLLDIEKQKGEI